MSFQNTTKVATGLSDFNEMMLTVYVKLLSQNISLKKLFTGTIWNLT